MTFVVLVSISAGTGASFRDLVAASDEEFEIARAKIYKKLDQDYERLDRRKVGAQLGLCFTLAAMLSWALAIWAYTGQHFGH